MLHMHFGINNPFSKKDDETVASKVVNISKNKAVDIAFGRNGNLIGGSFNVLKLNNLVLGFQAEVLGCALSVEFYDRRDYEEESESTD